MDTRENKQDESNTSQQQQKRVTENDNFTKYQQHLARQGQSHDVNSTFAVVFLCL